MQRVMIPGSEFALQNAERTYEFNDNVILGFVGKVDSGAPINKLGYT